jgi:hypothetical protein
MQKLLAKLGRHYSERGKSHATYLVDSPYCYEVLEHPSWTQVTAEIWNKRAPNFKCLILTQPNPTSYDLFHTAEYLRAKGLHY